jgi:hypothetical protein
VPAFQRERFPMRRRLTLLITVLAVLGAAAGAFAAPAGKVPRLVFPVIGDAQLTNSFGDARGSRSHEGEDIMTSRRSTAVAVEAGTVKWWTTSARAGCMLYLYGESGTTYLYIHLNNDLTKENDNRGSCVEGVAYWPGVESGDRVEAGEPIAYNGDSGDANAAGPHLHFEVHPNGGAAVAPYPYLVKADRLLFSAALGSKFSLGITGTVTATGGTSISVAADKLTFWPGSMKLGKVAKPLVVTIPPSALLERRTQIVGGAGDVDAIAKGTRVTVFTETAAVTADARRGAPGALVASRVQLAG